MLQSAEWCLVYQRYQSVFLFKGSFIRPFHADSSEGYRTVLTISWKFQPDPFAHIRPLSHLTCLPDSLTYSIQEQRIKTCICITHRQTQRMRIRIFWAYVQRLHHCRFFCSWGSLGQEKNERSHRNRQYCGGITNAAFLPCVFCFADCVQILVWRVCASAGREQIFGEINESKREYWSKWQSWAYASRINESWKHWLACKIAQCQSKQKYDCAKVVQSAHAGKTNNRLLSNIHARHQPASYLHNRHLSIVHNSDSNIQTLRVSFTEHSLYHKYGYRNNNSSNILSLQNATFAKQSEIFYLDHHAHYRLCTPSNLYNLQCYFLDTFYLQFLRQ